eukprot:sb/3463893/
MATYQPKFSIAKVERVVSGGKRLDTRKHSEDLTRDKGLKGKLSSLSLEHINTNNVLYCVRDSLELKTGATVERSKVVPGIQAASTLPRSYRQTNKKQVEIKPNGTQKGSYAAMYAARRQQLDKQEHQRARLLAKQRDENGRKWDTNDNDTAQDTAVVGPPGYPHTLPSAMYPHAQHPLVFHEPIDVSSRYFGDMLPTAVSPLPPIETSEDDDQDDSSLKKDSSPSPKKYSYSSPKPKITYKPYTLQEYKGVRAGYVRKVGGLGPDTENTKYKEKLSKAKRMNEYAQKLRDQHKMSEFPKRMAKPKRPPPSKATVIQFQQKLTFIISCTEKRLFHTQKRNCEIHTKYYKTCPTETWPTERERRRLEGERERSSCSRCIPVWRRRPHLSALSLAQIREGSNLRIKWGMAPPYRGILGLSVKTAEAAWFNFPYSFLSWLHGSLSEIEVAQRPRSISHTHILTYSHTHILFAKRVRSRGGVPDIDNGMGGAVSVAHKISSVQKSRNRPKQLSNQSEIVI